MSKWWEVGDMSEWRTKKWSWERIKINLNKNPGDLLEEEGLELLYLAKNSLDNGVIVEIGAYMGRSTCYLAMGAKLGNKGKVITIDKRIRPEFYKSIVDLELCDKIVTVEELSEEYINTFRQPIKLLFIDGDHRYTQAASDVQGYSHHLVVGGIIAVHDACPSKSGDGPMQAFQRIILDKGKYDNVRYIADGTPYGLAIAEKVKE